MSDNDAWQAPSPRSRGLPPKRRARLHDTAGALISDRLLATAIGGTAGLLSYLGWVLFSPWRRAPNAWELTGPGMWWVLIGAVLGLLGGLSFARTMLDHAIDDTREDASFSMGLAATVILVVGVGLVIFWLGTR